VNDSKEVRRAFFLRFVACAVLGPFHLPTLIAARHLIWESLGSYVADNDILLRIGLASLLAALAYLCLTGVVLLITRHFAVPSRRSGVIWGFRIYLTVWILLLVWIVVAFVKGPPL
jgi:hypothetical protein